MATTKSSQKLKVSFADFAAIVGLHLPMLQVLYPEVEAELKDLGKRNEVDVSELLPKTVQAVETLKEIYRLITT